MRRESFCFGRTALLLAVVICCAAHGAEDDDADVTVDVGRLTQWNLMVSSGGTSSFGPALFEYDHEGKRLHWIKLPKYGAETSRPHDLVVVPVTESAD